MAWRIERAKRLEPYEITYMKSCMNSLGRMHFGCSMPDSRKSLSPVTMISIPSMMAAFMIGMSVVSLNMVLSVGTAGIRL